ncbi:p115 like vesicle tethering protein [Crucibulum laeve]|uniref:p115 like vesicle tethering protein n=1 Tax=Crucibulum laeve TaxID=68775 RepID=A0A5C3MJV7_9AGAR|nr:p115 like vesicle tethering protein [Crucibulum laeve]
MEFFSQTYVALRGPTGAPQTPGDTIGRLSDRLSPATLLADRRAAVLALKGLSRDCKQDVGDRALPGLLDALINDAEVDADIGKAVLETLNILCDTEDSPAGGKELGFKHSDYVLVNEKTVHTLFSLLGDTNFYTRFATLQYLSTLLQNRRQAVQGYFLTASAGPRSVIAVLEDKREIIRNEAITMVQTLILQSPDIQKVLAFEGAFEKLFNTVTQEGGVDGGVVAQGALTCVDGLLRFNNSNQSYFRETALPPVLSSLLLFPTSIHIQEPAPQEFALQFWDEQKRVNASLVVGIMGMLISSKGNSSQEASPFTRCLVEIALASNAPTSLKTQALRLLPANINFPLSEINLTPYMPVPETNGEEWDRLEPASALDVLVELTLHGEYNGLDGGKPSKEGLELRTAAAAVFENFVRKEDIRHAIIQATLPPEGGDLSQTPPVTPLMHALAAPPNTSTSLDPAAVASTHLATLLFSHLLRSSSRAKAAARLIMPPSIHAPEPDTGSFFVPADGGPPLVITPEEPEDDEPPQSLLQVLSENLSLALLSRSRANTSDREAREWDRLVAGYLCLLAQWLWEDPKSVRDFLDAGGLGVLVEPINQTSEMDTIVPGLCTFLLGICYEFNREPGEITRATIYPILNRLGVDTLIGQIGRFREDERFKAVGPDSIVLPYPTPSNQLALKKENSDEAEIWFDWAFVDFWKSNYYAIQRGFSTEPDQLSSTSGQNAEAAMLIASLRDVIRKQSEEIETLQKQLKEAKSSSEEISALQSQVSSLSSDLHSSEEKCKEVEKEQEDLLVLLDEVTSKRKKDKARLKDAGLEVSEDEADEDEDDEDEDE